MTGPPAGSPLAEPILEGPFLPEPEELRGAVSAVFGAAAPLARRYAGHLATSAVQRGLIGPREVPRLWERHVLNCAVVGELLPREARVVDVGSGAGLPGLCLALARPDVSVVLLEPLERRATWLGEVVGDLGVAGRVEVVRARAEDAAPGRPAALASADVVTARAVAPLERLAGWCLPLARRGGLLLALKGRSAAAELTASQEAVRAAGGLQARVVEVGAGVVPVPTTVVSVTVGSAPHPDGGAAGISRAARAVRAGEGVGGRTRAARRQARQSRD